MFTIVHIVMALATSVYAIYCFRKADTRAKKWHCLALLFAVLVNSGAICATWLPLTVDAISDIQFDLAIVSFVLMVGYMDLVD